MNTDRLRELYRRWTSLEDDKADIAGDLSALFAEAKVDRLNTKALRAAFRRARNIERKGDEARQAEAETDDYLAVLLDVGTPFATRAGATPTPHDPETGEVHETEPASTGADALNPAPAPAMPRQGGSSSMASLTSDAGAVHGRCEPTAPPIPADKMPDIPEALRRTRAA